ncbi:hypothetical protein HANVADRAFT_98293 [Hanseniaspora valbyensis NRRL Y-1626]|uniref:FAD-binding FR-type domain-containing protein n=1 Tax=Hanseniaspora valbyensis NRRL Y-1626 TaxID=766949 RepID=A0A1B7THT6_9ASCO|nr:hypothetical protein HANVADRAFT_98293 [Hanseniaspora valbyensis NRRL Y-1626]
MKLLQVVFFITTYLFTFANAKLVHDPWVRADDISYFYGCKYGISSTTMYCKLDGKRSYSCQCTDTVAQGAFFYCAVEKTKNNTSDLKKFLKMFNDKCLYYDTSFTLDDLYTSYENATKYIKTPEEYGNYTVLDIVRTPITYDEASFQSGYHSYYSRYQNETNGIALGLAHVSYWFAVCLIGALHQLLTRLVPSVNTNTKLQKLINGVWMKRYKQPFKMFGVELGFIPNRIESLVIAGAFIIVMVGCCWGYSTHHVDIWYPQKYMMVTRYIADRTGYLACFAMNLTFLFAGRNNFFLWATGWNFSGFILYHKFVARVTVLLVFVHSMAFVRHSIKQGMYKYRYILDYWRWGSVATTCGMIMLVFSAHVFRKKMYDVFVAFHIIFALFFLVGSWFHLIYFGLQYYCYACIGVWSLDRVLRAVRMFVLFGGFRKNKVTIIKNPAAKENDEQLDPEDLFFRIDIDNYNKSLFKIKDGNFSFVYILHPKGFWQSHPFTMVKLKENDEFTIVVKVKKGLSRHIYNSIAKTGKDSKYFRVCVEGPYGMTKDAIVSQFENLSCVAIGTGVSGPLCYLNHHRNSELNEKSGAQNVLHWGVRSMGVVEAYKKELTQLAAKGNVKINIYCNRMKGYSPRQNSNSPSSESISEDKGETIADSSAQTFAEGILGLDNVELICDYMSVEEVVNNDMDESSSLVVVSCGYPIICDETRYQFLKALDTKKGSYQLIDDSQVW